MTEARRVEISVCPKHELRYNAAEELGCVRCRREDGAGVGCTPAAAGKRQAAPQPADGNASAPTQLLLAALLVAGTGAMF